MEPAGPCQTTQSKTNCLQCPSAVTAYLFDGTFLIFGLYMLFSLLYLAYHNDKNSTKASDNEGKLKKEADRRKTTAERKAAARGNTALRKKM